MHKYKKRRKKRKIHINTCILSFKKKKLNFHQHNINFLETFRNMISDGHTTPMDQTNFVPSNINDNNENFQHASNPNINLDTSQISSNNMTTPPLQNITYEFYFPVPNDTRVYHVTYTELNSIEIARRLNDRIDLSHLLNHQFPYHYYIQHSIRQQIVQQSGGYQQNIIPQQTFDTMNIQPTFQEYSNNNAYDAAPVPPNSSEDTIGYNGVQLNQNNQD